MLVLLLSTYSVLAKDPPNPATAMLNITAGQVGVLDNDLNSQRYGLEYRFKPFSKYKIVPSVGFAYSNNDDYFIYTDVRHDFWLNNRWVVSPSFGFGSFSDGEKIELGSDFEFRSGVEVAYRFNNNHRLGLAIYHLSNAGFSDKNPGTEALVLSYSIPIGR